MIIVRFDSSLTSQHCDLLNELSSWSRLFDCQHPKWNCFKDVIYKRLIHTRAIIYCKVSSNMMYMITKWVTSPGYMIVSMRKYPLTYIPSNVVCDVVALPDNHYSYPPSLFSVYRSDLQMQYDTLKTFILYLIIIIALRTLVTIFTLQVSTMNESIMRERVTVTFQSIDSISVKVSVESLLTPGT